MGNDTVQKVTQTMITLSSDRVEVVQYVDNGCHKNATDAEKVAGLTPCEIRHYAFEIPKGGGTQLSASRLFAPNTPSPKPGTETFEKDLWAKAPLMTTIAFDHAMRLLDHMADAKKSGTLGRGIITTAVGPVQVVPHCTSLGLQGVTIALNGSHRLDVDINDPSRLSEFSSAMCFRPTLSRIAAK